MKPVKLPFENDYEKVGFCVPFLINFKKITQNLNVPSKQLKIT